MTNYLKLNSISISDEMDFGRLSGDVVFQKTEERDDTLSNAFVRRIPSIGRTTAWEDVELELSDQDAYRPLVVGVPRLPKTFMVSPQMGEIGYQWICVATGKTTQHSHVSYLLPYTLLTEKQESFSPDFHETINMVNFLLQSEFARGSATSQAIEETPIEKISEIITAECLEFCKSQNIFKTLNECLYQVEQSFEFLQKVQAELSYFHDDEEVENEPHVEIEVKVNTSREIAEKNYDNWLDWFVKKIPDAIRKFFILTIDRV
ncbi:MAG: hypothetical protein ABR969_02745 [Sedimentisphaerales bacterium]|jgi:hypothetical protein